MTGIQMVWPKGVVRAHEPEFGAPSWPTAVCVGYYQESSAWSDDSSKKTTAKEKERDGDRPWPSVDTRSPEQK